MEILNTIAGVKIYDTTWIGWTLLGLGVIGVIAIMVGNAEKEPKAIGTGIIGIILVIALAYSLPVTKFSGKYEPTTYEVKLTDKNYVIDAQKYIIVGQRGDIITLQDVIK